MIPRSGRRAAGASVITLRYTSVHTGRRQRTAVTEVALDKLGARGISSEECEQLLRNHHATVRNPRDETASGTRRLMIGRTNGGRVLAVVAEQTLDPTTWLVVTGWEATDRERKILGS